MFSVNKLKANSLIRELRFPLKENKIWNKNGEVQQEDREKNSAFQNGVSGLKIIWKNFEYMAKTCMQNTGKIMQSVPLPTLLTLHFIPNKDRQFWLQKLWFINKCQKEESCFSCKLGKFYNDSVTETGC